MVGGHICLSVVGESGNTSEDLNVRILEIIYISMVNFRGDPVDDSVLHLHRRHDVKGLNDEDILYVLADGSLLHSLKHLINRVIDFNLSVIV